MADPLSTIASLIAVVQLTTAIISTCYDYRRGVKGASDSVMWLADEVKSLRDVFERLIKLVDDHPSQLHSVEPLTYKNGPLSKCSEELFGLQNKLKPASRWKALGRALKWPLSEPELSKVLSRLDRVKSTINMGLSIDQMYVSLSLPVYEYHLITEPQTAVDYHSEGYTCRQR